MRGAASSTKTPVHQRADGATILVRAQSPMRAKPAHPTLVSVDCEGNARDAHSSTRSEKMGEGATANQRLDLRRIGFDMRSWRIGDPSGAFTARA